jgi:formate dehydrogenase subunit delta
MDTQNLIKMANQIGDFFGSYPDQDEAQREIANHLKKFWAPRMRSQLLAHVEQTQGTGLQEIVLQALRVHRDALLPEAVQDAVAAGRQQG